MKHRFAILCERISVDKESNNLSLFNIIDEITVEYTGTKPTAKDKQVIPQPFTLTILTERSDRKTPETGTIRVSFKDDAGTDMFKPMIIQIDLSKFVRVRSNIQSNAMQITGEGV